MTILLVLLDHFADLSSGNTLAAHLLATEVMMTTIMMTVLGDGQRHRPQQDLAYTEAA